MKLKALKSSLKGKSVTCNGTTYPVDLKGFLDVKDAADARKLLSMKEFEKVGSAKKAEELKDAPSWELPAEGEEWPEPSAEMPREYLFAMAEAYEVEFAKNIGTEKLVARIEEAMFGSAEEE